MIKTIPNYDKVMVIYGNDSVIGEQSETTKE